MKRPRRSFFVAGLLLAVAGASVWAVPQGRAGTAGPPLPGAPPVATSTIKQAGSPSQGPRPAPLARPSARFSLLFLQYRKGDADAAIDSLSKWTEGDVIAEAVPSPNDDVWTRAALALFLTETGMRQGTFGRFSLYSPQSILLTGWGLDKNFEIYSFRAYSLVKDLTRSAPGRQDQSRIQFCSRWYDLSASYALRFNLAAREGLQEMANHELNDQPEVRLLIGSYYESIAGPFVPTAVFSCSHPRLVQLWFQGPDGCIRDPEPPPPGGRNPKREALWGFRTALEANPNLIEAHLRLGRFLHLIGQNIEAREHLERALHDSIAQHISFITYMAGLFLGELDEHQDRWTDAVAHIRFAVAAAPTAHIANIALGEALLKSGSERGWDEARHMFDDEDQAHPRALDPWFFYRYAQYWHVTAGLRELREVTRPHL